jgi:uncharacterized membrane protein YeaQ/YmgE (transglycosylase-associated protein family)
MVAIVTIALDPYTVLLWAFIGLVAGFLASKVVLGHGTGMLTDIAIGIVGAFAGGLLANQLGVTLSVPDHPIVSQILVAFFGATLLLLVLRLLGLGRHGRLR